MARKRRYWPVYLLIFVLIALIAVILYYMVNRFYLNDTVVFKATNRPLPNPLIGLAPSAENEEECENRNLVFVNLTWKDWEPEKGKYDIAGVEEKFHIAKWKESGKHAVLRFVCDIPSDETHSDIPEWLMDETGDGIYYDGELGMGYSPNYDNELFIKYHESAIKALADYCNKDYFVSYVELGSLGHWGEWHTEGTDGKAFMPSSENCWRYVLPYTNTFNNVHFLMRRNYEYATEGDLGVFNDMFGDKTQTEEWASQLLRDGEQISGSSVLTLDAYKDSWKTEPVGGEITSGISADILYGNSLNELAAAVEDCHASFLGPNVPNEESYRNAVEILEKKLGYKYYISELSTTFDFANDAVNLTLKWENAGSAPIYWDWPVSVHIFTKDNVEVFWETLNLNLSEILPGDVVTTTTAVPFTEEIRDGLKVGIVITSYDFKDRIMLGMEYDEDNPLEMIFDRQIIYSFEE